MFTPSELSKRAVAADLATIGLAVGGIWFAAWLTIASALRLSKDASHPVQMRPSETSVSCPKCRCQFRVALTGLTTGAVVPNETTYVLLGQH